MLFLVDSDQREIQINIFWNKNVKIEKFPHLVGGGTD